MEKLQPKVKTAAIAGTTGGAIAVIVLWILSENGVEMPIAVAGAATLLIAQVTSTMGGYFKKQ